LKGDGRSVKDRLQNRVEIRRNTSRMGKDAHMRKDVKLGFAVGGILIAVLVVYVLVVSGESGKPQLTKADGEVGSKLDISVDGKAAIKPENSIPQKPQQPAQWDAGAKASQPALPAIPPPVTVAENTGKQTDAPAGEKLAADKPVADKAGSSAEAAGKTPVAATGGDMDWGKLLNSDHMPLIAQTPVKVPANEFSNSVTPVQSLPPSQGAEPATPSRAASPADAAPAGASEPPSASALPAPAASPAAPSTSAERVAAASSEGSSATAHAGSAAAAGARTHVVREGETLSTIALAAYGSSNYYPHIIRANPNLDPKRMKVGTTINLPELPAKTVDSSTAVVASNAVAASAAPIDPAKQYRVQPGDSLYRISVKLYGRADRAETIHQINRQLLGDDAAKVKVGQILSLPEPPTQAQTAAATH
jgi:nucleoid-associated protein YgaU